MKDIKNFLSNINESGSKLNPEVNLLIQNSGAMSDQINEVKNLLKFYKSRKINLYYYDPKGIHELENIDDFNPGGPHVANFNDIYKFMQNHLGVFTLIYAI